MTGVEEIQNEIVEELSLFNDWIEKYEYVIELGKDEIDFDDDFLDSPNGADYSKLIQTFNNAKR